MIKLYRYVPGWTVPCISPCVTETACCMTMAGIEYEPVGQDLTRLDEETPYGKLPVIEEEDGNRTADSTDIVDHLRERHGDTLDEGAAPAERAEMRGWNRPREFSSFGIRRPPRSRAGFPLPRE